MFVKSCTESFTVSFCPTKIWEGLQLRLQAPWAQKFSIFCYLRTLKSKIVTWFDMVSPGVIQASLSSNNESRVFQSFFVFSIVVPSLSLCALRLSRNSLLVLLFGALPSVARAWGTSAHPAHGTNEFCDWHGRITCKSWASSRTQEWTNGYKLNTKARTRKLLPTKKKDSPQGLWWCWTLLGGVKVHPK